MCPTVDFGSDHDPMVRGPESISTETAWDFLSPSLSLSLSVSVSVYLSLKNKQIKIKENKVSFFLGKETWGGFLCVP